MQSIKSITKKISTIMKNGSDGIEAIKEGVKNHSNYNEDVELLALERVKICLNCVHLITEPNTLLRVSDDLIPEADEMSCNDCGCAIPYKLRQSKIKCDKWIK